MPLDFTELWRKIKRETKWNFGNLTRNNSFEKIFKLPRFSCEIENMWSCQSVRGTSCRLCNASLISRNFDGLFTFILKKISIFIPEQLLLLLQLYEVFEPKFTENENGKGVERKRFFTSDLMICRIDNKFQWYEKNQVIWHKFNQKRFELSRQFFPGI